MISRLVRRAARYAITHPAIAVSYVLNLAVLVVSLLVIAVLSAACTAHGCG